MAVLCDNKPDSVGALVARQFVMLLWKPRFVWPRGNRQEHSGIEYSIKADLSTEIVAEIPTTDKLASPP